jgi:nitroreductase
MDAPLARRDFVRSLMLAALVPRGAAAAERASLEKLLGRRRMVRRFRPEPVDEHTVRRLIDAATRAPSAGHTQPWGFVVVRDSAKRRDLGRAAFGQAWLAEAPLCIVACADPERARARYGARAERYAVIDTAFACMLLLLAVTDRGLGACFVGAFDDERVRRLLALPATVQPLAVIPVGHPAETPPRRKRRPLAAVVHSERWAR